jgi:hypothetical protein
VLRLAAGEELRQAADDALNRGLYTHSLGELATSSQLIMADVGPLFEATLRELGIPLPSTENAVDFLLKRSIRLIAEGTVSPYQGLHDLVSELYDEFIYGESVTRYGESVTRAGDSRGIHDLIGAYYTYDHVYEQEPKGALDQDVLDRQVVELAIRWNREHTGAAIDSRWVEWNDGTVKKLAQSIRAKRTFHRLPVLADALEEAGCQDADILAHCRQAGEHVRGCWVVDLLLGKE